MNNFKKEEKMTKCILCLEDIEKDTLKECPNCGNTFGLSSEDTLKVTSIGDMTFRDRINRDFFVFTFDFDFDLKSHHNDILYKRLKNTYEPFLGVEVHTQLNSNIGFAGVRAVAVFEYNGDNSNDEKGFIELEVDLSKEIVEELKNAITPFIIDSMEEDSLCDCNCDCTDDDCDCCDCDCDCGCNSDYEDDDYGFDFLEEDLDNIVELEEIANAMYNAVKSESFPITDSQWNKLDSFVKCHMASLLKKDKEDLDELMRCNSSEDASKCSESLKSKIAYILEKCYAIAELALSEANSLMNLINEEDEEDDFCDEYDCDNYEDDDDFYDDICNPYYDDYEDFYDEGFDALYDTLDSMDIHYIFYQAVEASDSDITAHLITILDNKGNEVLYIAVTSDDKYHVFENVKEEDGFKVFDANDNTSVILNLDELTSLLEKMNLNYDRCSNNKYSNKFTDNTASLDFEMLESAPEFMIKEFILKHLDKLSNEELMNELNNRLSTK